MDSRDQLFDRAVNEACRYLDATGYWGHARAALTHWATRVRYVARLDTVALIESCLSRPEGEGRIWRGGPAGAWIENAAD